MCTHGEHALDDVLGTLLTAYSQPVDDGSSHADSLCTKRQGFDNVRTSPDPAVKQNRQFVADGLADLGENLERGNGAIILTATYVKLSDSSWLLLLQQTDHDWTL